MYARYKSNYHSSPGKGRMVKHRHTHKSISSLVIISESKIEMYILSSLMKNKLKNLYCLLMQIKSTVFTLPLGSDWAVTNRDRPLRRFTLGRVGQASSSMPECKPRFRGPNEGQPGRRAARAGSPCNRHSRLQVGPLLQDFQDRFFCSTCTSAQKGYVPFPSWAAAGRGGSEERFSPFDVEVV